MTLKSLVTSLTAGAAAAAFVGAAAAGVTSIAAGAGIASAQPGALYAPLPAAPAPELEGPLVSTLSALSGPGSFAGGKSSFIQHGLGRIEARVADNSYANAAAQGYFPLNFAVSNIDRNGGVATASVTATAQNGAARQPERGVHRRPEPDRLADLEASAMALLARSADCLRNSGQTVTRVRRAILVRSAATFVAALGLSACVQPGQSEHPAATPSPAPASASSTGLPDPIPDSPGGPALPPSTALVDVMARLSDPAVPGTEKISLIERGVPEEAAGLDRFAVALRDSGSLPLTFEARDLAWSQSAPGNVVATVVIRTAKPQRGEFTYPMEFAQTAGSWQLTRQTADLLLQVGPTGTSTAAPPPPTPPR